MSRKRRIKKKPRIKKVVGGQLSLDQYKKILGDTTRSEQEPVDNVDTNIKQAPIQEDAPDVKQPPAPAPAPEPAPESETINLPFTNEQIQNADVYSAAEPSEASGMPRGGRGRGQGFGAATTKEPQRSDFPDTAEGEEAYNQALAQYYVDQAETGAEETPSGGNTVPPSGTTGTTTQPGGGVPTEAPTNIQIERPDLPEVPQIEVAEVEEGPASQVMEMEATTPAEVATAQAAQAQAAQAAEAAQAAMPTAPEAATMTAATVEGLDPMEGATGTVSEQAQMVAPTGEITNPAVAAERDAAAEQAALAITPDFQISEGVLFQERSAPRQMGTEAKNAATQRLIESGLDPETSAAIAENAQAAGVGLEGASREINAAVAALPEEALVSSQLDNLLGDLDNGEIPSWARPAVDAVNQSLAARGIDASTVGRDALFNAIIQSAMPIAQSNAQALQARAAQNLNNQQQAVMLEAQQKQERAMFNAQTLANIDMARFNAQQQTALANSAFMQTMTLRDFDANQQAAMQNATAYANMDLANLSAQERAAAQNAQAFLQMDMQNLQNEQQARVLNQQMQQQTMLSNQAAENAARQFNAANQQQMDQFITNLSTQVSQFNTAQTNAMNQFNTSEQNRITAQNAQNATQVALANAQMATEINRFNAQMEQQREQFNTANAQAIEQADIAWRLQANTINTAAQNAANQQNVMNAYNLTTAELQFIWQELRDNAQYTRQAYESDQDRQTQLYMTAIGNEAAAAGGKDATNIQGIINLIERYIGG